MSLPNNLEIVFQDSDILVVNKPSGLVVNRSKTAKDKTLQDHISEILDFKDITDDQFLDRSGIVHRLDKDTSGLLVIAKNPKSFYKIQKQFKRREVIKEYHALLFRDLKDEIIEIDAPIKRDLKNRVKMSISQTGRAAQTRIEKVKTIDFKDFTASYVKIYPLTGRTHQIRIHTLAINHPVLGDQIYLTKKQLEMTQMYVNRLMLHAKSLTLAHPITGEKIRFDTTLPTQFVQLL